MPADSRVRGHDLNPEATFEHVVELDPTATALTQGPEHRLVLANAAFCAIPGLLAAPAPGVPFISLFDPAIGAKLEGWFDRVLREKHAVSDQHMGAFEAGGRSWNCTAWPVLDDAGTASGVAVVLRVGTHTERILLLQRAVAERLLLSALRASDATDHANELRNRAAFLADTGRSLAESLDTDATRTSVAGLSLPLLAEWCIVDLLEDDGLMNRLAIVHSDPATQDLLRQRSGHWLPVARDRYGIPAMMRNPQPQVIVVNVGDEPSFPTGIDEGGGTGTGPLLTVPLVAGKKLIGAITFVGSPRERTFSLDDIELAENLAARSALALENARLYGDALVLREKAEAAALLTKKFIATVSHELRSPLNTIFGYVDLISRGIRGPVTPEQRADLDRISTSQRQLMVLITELLNFMRVGSGRAAYDAVPVDVRDAVAQAVEAVAVQVASREQTCEVTTVATEVVASADPDSVQQILANLLSNAIKFTDPGGQITISYHTIDGERIAIAVTDTGRGIPADKLELVFEPFVQARNDDTWQHGGSGLGLPISRELACAMKGDLTVQSDDGAGATFTFTLPAWPREPAAL